MCKQKSTLHFARRALIAKSVRSIEQNFIDFHRKFVLCLSEGEKSQSRFQAKLIFEKEQREGWGGLGTETHSGWNKAIHLVQLHLETFNDFWWNFACFFLLSLSHSFSFFSLSAFFLLLSTMSNYLIVNNSFLWLSSKDFSVHSLHLGNKLYVHWIYLNIFTRKNSFANKSE